MRRSVIAVALCALLASLISLTSSPGVTAPVVPAGIAHPGTDTGNLYERPESFTAGQQIQLYANFANDQALKDVTFFKETSPGSDDYTSVGVDEANKYGNAYFDYVVPGEQRMFAQTDDGVATEIDTLSPEVISPATCTETGNLSTTPTVITQGAKIRINANFQNNQANKMVTFYKKSGANWIPIGEDEANTKYGNAYLSNYQVDAEQDIFAMASGNECTEVQTLTPVIIKPGNYTENGTLAESPDKVFAGKTTKVTANFPSGSFDVTLFEETEPDVWVEAGSTTSNSSGDATFDKHAVSATHRLFAATSTGLRTELDEVLYIPTKAPSGGPSKLGTNVIYATTDNGKTPTTKGVDYEGRAVILSGDEVSESLDLETIAVRGNSTAGKAKKPYKMKFEDKQKPFGMKNDKTWVLLANYIDWTLIRSKVAWNLGDLLNGLKWTPKSTFTELYINGKYYGSYQMVESIKIDNNRVDVDEETGQVIEFDPHWKSDGVPGFVGNSGMNYAWKDPDEFKTLDPEDGGGPDPEGLSNAKINDMKKKIRNFETVLYGADEKKDWSKVHYGSLAPEDDWQTYLDLDSAVDYYLAREFTKDNDADFYRSNFFYTNDVDPDSPDKLFMGPIWDFDRSAGSHDPSSTNIEKPTGWWARGDGSKNHNTNKIHWFTRIAKDPRFLKALHDRWAAKKQLFAAVGPSGVSDAVKELGGANDYDLGKQVAENDRDVWKSYGSRYKAKASSYSGELAWVRDWYTDRYNWMNSELIKTPPPIPN